MASLTERLPFREIWLSITSIIIFSAAFTSPLLLALSLDTIPSSLEVVSEGILENATIEVAQATIPPTNRSVILMGLRGFIDSVVLAEFVFIGVLAVLTLARPLEYKYFFLEILFRGGRLRVYGERILLLLAASAFSAALTSLTAASILYVNNALPTMLDSFIYMYVPLMMACISSISLASLTSLSLRRASDGLLLFLASTGLILLAGSRYRSLTGIVLATRIIYDGSGLVEYITFITVTSLISLYRVSRIEY